MPDKDKPEVDDLIVEPAVAEEVELPDTEGGRTDKPKADAAADGDAEAGEEDAPRSREAAEDESDPEHKRRGRKNRARREAQRRREAAKDAKIAEYEARLARLESGQQKVEESQRARDIGTLTSNRDAAISRVNSYEELINQATVEGKPAGALVKAMLAAQAEAAQYDQAINWLKSQPAAPTNGNGADKPKEAAPAPELPAAVVAFRDSFLEDHDWIDTNPNTTDRDSKYMQKLSDQLAERGILPNTARHWRELERLGAEGLPHRFGGDDEGDEPARKGPPMSARRDDRPVNGKSIKLPAEMVQMMKETGQWDDPKRRAKVAADYASLVKSQQANAGAR